ncbi:MAG: S-layer homology domain-containing protein [Bacillota bacterium]
MNHKKYKNHRTGIRRSLVLVAGLLSAILLLASRPGWGNGPPGDVISNELTAVITVSSGGGGGGAPPPPPPPAPVPGTIGTDELDITTSNGETSAIVPEDVVQTRLEAGEAAIAVDLRSIDTPLNIVLPQAAVAALADRGATLTVATAWAELMLPPGSLPAERDVTVRVEAAIVPPGLPPTVQPVGQAVNVEVHTAAGQASLAKRVTLVLGYDTSRAGDPAALFVYRLSDDGTLTCLGGSVANGRAAVDLAHLSRYGVMAYRSSLADVAGHWAKRDILFMNARGIVRGVSATSFAPERPVTRAEFAALMLRVLGLAEYRPAQATFADVAPGKWYFGAVEAANRAGLVKGVSGGRFDPLRAITREEMAVLVLRALEKAAASPALDPAETEKFLARFGDRGEIAPWARAGVAAAVKAGIIRGNPDGTFAPRDVATRAAAAVMGKKVLETAGLI